MKIRIAQNRFTREIGLPVELLKTLGWAHGDFADLDIPLTGGGLRITKASDPIVLLGGVKEKIT